MSTQLNNCQNDTQPNPQSFDDSDSPVHIIINQENISIVFQPIINLNDGSIFGYEALARGPESSLFHAPISLFQAAEAIDRLFELEFIARKKAIQRFIELDLPQKLFINISPLSLQDPNFQSGQTLALIEKYGLPSDRIVIEITEHHPTPDYQLLLNAVQYYRDMGFSIALDDLGEGHSSLRLWSELRPEYVKLDKHFITHLETEDKHKLQFVKIITELAQSVNTQVIAEGIETPGCLELLQSINVHLGQGYYFAKPNSIPFKKPQWKIPHFSNAAANHLSRYARDLVKDVPYLEANTHVTEAVDYFLKHPEHQAIAVVNDVTVLGLLERKQLTDIFSSRYGRELNARKNIDEFVDRRSLIVSANTPLEIISKMITQRDSNNAQGVFIVTDADRYVGLGYFNDLLRAITETKIALAKSANPLSGLPGNQAIENAIQKRLNNRKDFLLMYVDLDHFKAFNDYFGYENGDKVLLALARILEDQTHHAEFIGHIGGDDFIMLWKEKDWQKRLERIFEEFISYYPKWYKKEHIKQKGFTGKDRNDQSQFFSLMSLSVGVIPVNANKYEYHHELSLLSSEAKKYAKSANGNSWHLLKVPG